MKRIMMIIGTRPEAIKMAPVIQAVRNLESLEAIVVSTGQHREMLQQVVDLFQIDVHHDLAVMQPDQDLASLTARLITTMSELMERLKPDMVVAQGDTTTVFASALTAFYRRAPFAHVEAGLRTGDIWAPFPEEANRRLTSPLATLHFAPTEVSRANLLREGVPDARITVTGNTVIDALQMEIRRQKSSEISGQVEKSLVEAIGADWDQSPYVLITGHRRENFGNGFEEICTAIQQLAKRFPDHRFVYPVHLNPNVQRPVYERLGSLGNVRLIPPQGYRAFIALLRYCKLVLTDSGGIQEEAPSLGKPVLVMRDNTERPEGIAAGTVMMVGAHAASISGNVERLLTDAHAYRRMAEAVNPYGDGNASSRIAKRIDAYLAEGRGASERDVAVTASPAARVPSGTVH